MSTIVIIGAGAAGLMAAIHAAGPGRRVVMLERTADGGRKILISGGGRCNVLPSELDPARYVTASSANTMRNLLRSWPLADQREFFETTLRLPLVLEPETGKLFPVANRSRVVRDALVNAAVRAGVEWNPNTTVTRFEPHGRKWKVHRDAAPPIDADAVIVATGGLSVPQTGSDGFGLRILAELGHTIHPTYPALTPLTITPPVFADLAGVSLTVTLRAASTTETRDATGGFLFTHRGYSGPSALDVSHVAVRGALVGEHATLMVSWTTHDANAWTTLLTSSAQHVATVVRRELPTRLADRLLTEAGVAYDTTLATLTRADRIALIDALTRFSLPWSGDEGYRKAEVTGGGLSLAEVSPKTLESRMHPGLFLCGELLDAFGPIGGYNFAWAWSTGRLAGRGAAQFVSPPAS
ncbi:MAG: aminoacetone oxidase family FAD-binding enzyme [Gemmatimonadales bacterium]